MESKRELLDLLKELEENVEKLASLKLEKFDLVEKKKGIEFIADMKIIGNSGLKNERERKVFKNNFLIINTDYKEVEDRIKDISKEEIKLESKISVIKYKINTYIAIISIKEGE